MKLPLSDVQARQVVELFRALERRDKRPVLVGGLVPPLLLVAMDPDAYQDFEPRRTADCDMAIDIAVDVPGDWAAVEALLAEQGFAPRRGANQFRWQHSSGLQIDPMPVPAGIERGDPGAIEFARRLVEREPREFYRGYELALVRFVEVEIAVGDTKHPLRIAGLVALLAMKLQAWMDRRYERRRDAHDICWLLRELKPEIAAAEMRQTRALRSDLVDEVLRRLSKEFSEPDQQGLRHYASERGYLLEDVIERHCLEVVRAVQRLLRLCGE